jgi:putative tryptophan/tyrosine transport system substrate-binding protein
MSLGEAMRRRDFIKVIASSVAAWPVPVSAQQPTMPVVGYLAGASREAYSPYIALFLQGLNESGYVQDGFFMGHRSHQLAELALRHRVPSIHAFREFVVAGGLISYGGNVMEAWHQAGIYTGRILKGQKPTDLPVQLPTRFEMVINLKTAHALGLTIPPTLLALADEVIE